MPTDDDRIKVAGFPQLADGKFHGRRHALVRLVEAAMHLEVPGYWAFVLGLACPRGKRGNAHGQHHTKRASQAATGDEWRNAARGWQVTYRLVLDVGHGIRHTRGTPQRQHKETCVVVCEKHCLGVCSLVCYHAALHLSQTIVPCVVVRRGKWPHLQLQAGEVVLSKHVTRDVLQRQGKLVRRLSFAHTRHGAHPMVFEVHHVRQDTCPASVRNTRHHDSWGGARQPCQGTHRRIGHDQCCSRAPPWLRS